MNERLKPFEEKMKKTIGNLDGELSAIRAGRANPNVLNKIMVDYYGTPTPIFPELTEDRRKELVKDVKKKGEAAKVAIRNIRRDGIDSVKKLKGTDVSEDEMKDMENDLQKLTDKYVKEVDKAVEVKSKEVMTV